MPVRIEEVPNLPMDDGFRISRMDPRVAAAPAKALGDVAEAIGSVGGAFDQIARQAQEQVNETQVLDTQSGWRRAAADFQRERAREADPAKQVQMTDEFIARQRAAGQNPAFAPAVRQALDQSFHPFADQLFLGGRAAAADTSRARLETSVNQRLNEATTEGEVVAAHSAAVKGGIAKAADLPVVLSAFRQKIDRQRKDDDAANHPREFLSGQAADPAAKADPVAHQNRVDLAKGSLLKETADTVQDVIGLVFGGKITTPAQLGAVVGDRMGETAREHLQQLMMARADPQAKREQASQGYQDEVLGKVSSMISGFSLESDDFDGRYAQMAALTSTLPPDSPAREQLATRLEGLKEQRQVVVKTGLDEALRMVDQATADGFFGRATSKQNLGSIVDAGFVSGPHLRNHGYSPEQIRDIEAAGDNEWKIARLRELYAQRSGPVTSTPQEAAAFEALRDHKAMTDDVEWANPEVEISGPAGPVKISAEAAVHRTAGMVRRRMIQWSVAHPQDAADYDKAMAKLKEFSRPAANERYYQEQGFGSPATSSAPVQR